MSVPEEMREMVAKAMAFDVLTDVSNEGKFDGASEELRVYLEIRNLLLATLAEAKKHVEQKYVEFQFMKHGNPKTTA